ncbi:unnamed protein product [Colias eurytheme]|nr:unnamed protein product [Colias eurytheme]
MGIMQRVKPGLQFVLRLNPEALAVSGARGSSIANPVSQVFINSSDKGSIMHSPVATAVAGPGGIAHALSELDSTQYLPFYGGAKGQYLEIKKDTAGSVLSEKIVPEDSLSNENVFKNSEDNLQSKLFATNLGQLKSLSSSLLRLHNLGRRLGYLGTNEKERFKTQLASLGEAASNTIKIVDEIGEDFDVLFKKNKPESPVSRGYENYDDSAEEGISVGSDDNDNVLDRATIAEAKPVGLAVVGENGLAASRPMATAVAASGVALARPIATAIAGIDPTLLGIAYQHNPFEKSIKVNGKYVA